MLDCHNKYLQQELSKIDQIPMNDLVSNEEEGSYASTLIYSGLPSNYSSAAQPLNHFSPPGFQQHYHQRICHSGSPSGSRGVVVTCPLYPSSPSLPPPSSTVLQRKPSTVMKNCIINRKHRRKYGAQKGKQQLFDSDYSVTTTTISPTSPDKGHKILHFVKRRKFFVLGVFLLILLLLALFIFIRHTGFLSSETDEEYANFSNSLPISYHSSHIRHFSPLLQISKPIPPQLYSDHEMEFDLPPLSIVYSHLTVQHNLQLLLNFSVFPQSNIVVYARQSLRPTPARHDFQRIISGNRLHLSDPSNVPQKSFTGAHYYEHKSVVLKQALFYHAFSAGRWFFGFLNDDTKVQRIRLIIVIANIEQSFAPSKEDGGTCPFDCFGKGMCTGGTCHCHPGYSGVFCEETTCPVLCSGNGVFSEGRCLCNDGFDGLECERPITTCRHSNCTPNGRCTFDGNCKCDDGWTGEFCNELVCPASKCSEHGICQNGQCFCLPGWFGERCEEYFDQLKVCNQQSGSQHQALNSDTYNTKRTLSSSEESQKKACSKPCKNGGECIEGSCHCMFGWNGDECSDRGCKSGCEFHGKCENGNCQCFQGWSGDYCEIEQCPKNCRNRGQCKQSSTGWKCFCDEGFFGNECEFLGGEICDDGVDNDGDGLTDCEDSADCCSHICSSDALCLANVIEVENVRQDINSSIPFFDKVKFLFDGEMSVQRYVQSRMDPQRVSVIRGQVLSKFGGPLSGVRVSDVHYPQNGFTITRGNNWKEKRDYAQISNNKRNYNGGYFDLVVNGGGFVTLQFIRQPYGSYSHSLFVPWNRIINIGEIFLDSLQNNQTENDACSQAHRISNVTKPLFITSLDLERNKRYVYDENAKYGVNSSVFVETGTLQFQIGQLNYNSLRSDGQISYIHMQLFAENNLNGLERVHLEIRLAGRIFKTTFAAIPKLSYTFSWDRKNVYEQLEYGIVEAEVFIGYSYENCHAQEQVIWRKSILSIEGAPIRVASRSIFGTSSPWGLTFLHHFDPTSGIIERGDGSSEFLKLTNNKLLRTVVGFSSPTKIQRKPTSCDESSGSCVHKEFAKDAKLLSPMALAIAPNGAIFIGDYNKIRRLSPDLLHLETVLEIDQTYASHQYGLAFDSSSNTGLYISIPLRRQIWKLIDSERGSRSPASNFIVAVGNGEVCLDDSNEETYDGFCGDNGPAKDAQLRFPTAMVFDAKGDLYFIDGRKLRVLRKHSQNIRTIVKSQIWYHPTKACVKDTIPIDHLNLEWPTSLTIDPRTGRIYLVDSFKIIYALEFSTKSAHIIAGQPMNCRMSSSNKGAQGNEISSRILNNIQAISFHPNNHQLYLAESNGRQMNLIKSIQFDSNFEATSIRTVAGRVSNCNCHSITCPCIPAEENVVATDALLHNPTALASHPDGTLFIADQGNSLVMQIELMQMFLDPHNQTYRLISSNSAETFVFDQKGYHLSTTSKSTGETLHKFSYSDGWRLKTIEINPNSALNTKEVITLSSQNDSILLRNSNEEQKYRLQLGADHLKTSLVTSIDIIKEKQLPHSLKFTYDNNTNLVIFENGVDEEALFNYDLRGQRLTGITTQSGRQFQISQPEFTFKRGLATEIRLNGTYYKTIFYQTNSANNFKQSSGNGRLSIF